MTLLGILASGISGHLAPLSPVAGYTAWYDASDTATISDTSNAVTQWNDKSANGYNLTQSTSTRRPGTNTNTLNSKNVITFTGDDYLDAATASNWTFLSNSNGSTVFVALFCDTAASAGFFLDTNGSSSANVGTSINRIANDNLSMFVGRGVGGTYVIEYNPGALTDNAASYFSIKLDPANATAAQRAIVKINGGSNLTGNPETGAASSSTPFRPLRVGALGDDGSAGFVGKMAEILIYNSMLSDANIILNNSYLANKWGI